MLKGGCQKVRQDGHEVLCTERAMVSASMDGPIQAFVVKALTATGKAEGRGKRQRRGTDHANACRSLHVANTAQVLEVEEVQRGRGLRVAGGADHRLRRQMHQIDYTLQVDGKRATFARCNERRGPEEVKCPSQTKQEGAGNMSTSERTGSSERPSEVGSVSVRPIDIGCGGREGGEERADRKRAARRALRRGCDVTWEPKAEGRKTQRSRYWSVSDTRKPEFDRKNNQSPSTTCVSNVPFERNGLSKNGYGDRAGFGSRTVQSPRWPPSGGRGRWAVTARWGPVGH